MSRVHYVGANANGAEPPLTELEEEKLKGQRLANEIAETKLRRLHEEVLEKSEVKLVFETTLLVIRQETMRGPSQAITDLRGLNLSRDALFAIKMSLDRTNRSMLDKAEVSLRRALRNPREVYNEMVGIEAPSEKAVKAAARKKERGNAKRAVRRKAGAR